MSFPYIPRGDGEEEAMLAAIGVSSFADLLRPVPEGLRLESLLNLPEPRSESEVVREMEDLSARNAAGPGYRSFLGAGSYDHTVSAAVDHLSFRSEFYTAYTPYQPEVGQGTLTAIFEFQTMLSELTGMDLANASLYDGATALAEAALLAATLAKKPRIVVAGPLHPNYLQVLRTFASGLDIAVEADPAPDGRIDRAWLRRALSVPAAAVVASSPNFLGVVEDLAPVFAEGREQGAMGIMVFQPHALALYRTPGELGADLAVGEGMALGTPPSLGGPALGLFTAKLEYARYAPGRLIGETIDRNGKRCYVMTLQTREQHIRRAKATSNICTNQGLLALRATIAMALLGPKGMRELAEQCLEKAHYLAERIAALPGFRLPVEGPFFREFTVECPVPAAEVAAMAAGRRILPGVDLGRFDPAWNRRLLVAVTEKHTRADLDALVDALAACAKEAAHV